MLKIYTDGSCSGNPGRAGWAIVIVAEDDVDELSGRLPNPEATNNQAELMAIIKALDYVYETGRDAVIYSDSAYAVNGITKYLKGWKFQGWKNRERETIKNLEMWQRIDKLFSTVKHKVAIEHIKAHSGHEWNERADKLAREAAGI